MKHGTLFIVVTLAAAAATVVALRRPAQDSVAVASTAPSAPHRPRAPASSPRLERGSEQPAPTPPHLETKAELDAFLADLMKTARERPELDDQDLRLGVAAINAMADRVSPAVIMVRTRHFLTDYAQLKKQREMAPLKAELAGLVQQIQTEPSPLARQRLIADYHKKASLMPELYRIAALDRLNAALRGGS